MAPGQDDAPGPGQQPVDVRDLRSVRRALRARLAGVAPEERLGDRPGRGAARRWFRGLARLRRSPLARRIVLFNLVALALLVGGMLALAPSRDSFALQRARGLVGEAGLLADFVTARLGAGEGGATRLTGAELDGLRLQSGAEAFLFAADGRLLARIGPEAAKDLADATPLRPFGSVWARLQGAPEPGDASPAARLVEQALGGVTRVEPDADAEGRPALAVAVPIPREGPPVGVVALRSAPGEIDALLARERGQVLRMFLAGALVSVALSLVLASTIANPLATLVAAAETGRDRSARPQGAARVRIPDLSGRQDEIGRLSAALRGMVAALYERIEANEQFAADVAHEIKNPLASLRSAVGTLRVARRQEQWEKLLEIIEHDVRRLDRLVTDISAASRLDAELVKEEEEPFDLGRMLRSLDDVLGEDARAQGIDLILDVPAAPIVVTGLEGRLAQVFVNLIVNAISFCEEGDAIRVWARKREARVLVVVEDTGPGIPEDALSKIFQRFYSERPEGQFGQNSGLGLAISKQIVEAHGGVIWAENIRPTDADPDSPPLGARFVVGLPI